VAKFPVDAPKSKVLRAFQNLGFVIVREREHVSLVRTNPDGTKTPMTLPNHPYLKGATLRSACTQAGIFRDEFLVAYEKA
jgi:hypothetical protein